LTFSYIAKNCVVKLTLEKTEESIKKYNPQTMATWTTQNVLKLNKTQHKKTLKDEQHRPPPPKKKTTEKQKQNRG
jgi:hypothetical protein